MYVLLFLFFFFLVIHYYLSILSRESIGDSNASCGVDNAAVLQVLDMLATGSAHTIHPLQLQLRVRYREDWLDLIL
jgi:hypothetical protein